MKNKIIEAREENESRAIDQLARETHSWIGRSWVFIRKTEVRTWQGVFILAFFAGLAAAIILLASIDRQTKSKAAGETASLYLSPSTFSVASGANIQTSVMLDTDGNNVVVARAVVAYDPSQLQLLSYDTSDSVFADGNTCVYNDKPCEIIDNDPVGGTLGITLAKPTPGVNTGAGLLAVLTFKVLAPASSAPTISLSYLADGSYEDSDVIFDDGSGTDILRIVAGANVAVAAQEGSGDSVVNPDAPTIIEDSYSPYLAVRNQLIHLDPAGVSYTKLTALSFKGVKSDLAGGSVKVYSGKKLVRTATINDIGVWNVAYRAKRDKTESYRFVYRDAGGNTVNVTPYFKIKVDTKKPVMTRPASRITVSPGSVVTASASGGPIAKYNFIFSSTNELVSSAERTFTIPADTPVGNYTLTVTAEDRAGNISKARKVKVTVR